jgi:hypothetical protein
VSTGRGSSAQGANTRYPTQGESNPRRQCLGKEGDSEFVTEGSKAPTGESPRFTNLPPIGNMQTDPVRERGDRIRESAENKGAGGILGEQMVTDMEITDKRKSLLQKPRADKIALMKMHGSSELAEEGGEGSMGREVSTGPIKISTKGIGLNLHVGPEKGSRQDRKDPSPPRRKTWKRRAREGQMAHQTTISSPRGKRNTMERGEPVLVGKKKKHTQRTILEEEWVDDGDEEDFQLKHNLVGSGLARAVMQPRQPS